jgi:hypothetical protein
MKDEPTIRKLTDFVMLNACSIDSSGFYNGKAGLSLCLFEVARLYNDDTIEESAFDLLQESLLSKTEQINFESGLSGIGFILAYLIENKLLDADYIEIFGEKTKMLLSELSNRSNKDGELLSVMSVLVFLIQIERFCDCIVIKKLMLKQLEESLQRLFAQIADYHAHCVHTSIIALFNFYLKMAYISEMPVNTSLIDVYCQLYHREYFVRNYATGFYLQSLQTAPQDVISNNMDNAIKNAHTEAMPLPEKISLSYLCYMSGQDEQSIKRRINPFSVIDDAAEFEKFVVNSIPEGSFIAGYEWGVARLLLFYVFMQDRASGKDVSRFRYLF